MNTPAIQAPAAPPAFAHAAHAQGSAHAAAHAHAGMGAHAQTRRPILLLIEPDYMLRRTVALTARSLDIGEVHESGSFEAAARLLEHTRFDGLIVALGHAAPACPAAPPAVQPAPPPDAQSAAPAQAAPADAPHADAQPIADGPAAPGAAQAAVDPALTLIERVRMGATYCDAGTPIAVMAEGLNAACVASLREMDIARILVKPAKVKTILEAVIAIATRRGHASPHAHA